MRCVIFSCGLGGVRLLEEARQLRRGRKNLEVHAGGVHHRETGVEVARGRVGAQPAGFLGARLAVADEQI